MKAMSLSRYLVHHKFGNTKEGHTRRIPVCTFELTHTCLTAQNPGRRHACQVVAAATCCICQLCKLTYYYTV